MKKSFETVKINLFDEYCEIVLNRPEKKNALNPQMIKELKSAFKWAEKIKEIKIIIFKGAGDSFCSGADLKYLFEMKAYSLKKNIKDSEFLADLFLKIYHCTKPVIAVIKGAALAGGSGLACACDYIIATPDAKFGFPEVKIGFVPALVSEFVIRQIGERKAKDLLISGRIITAEEALQIGLINSVTKNEKLQASIEMRIKELKKNSNKAMSITKEIFNQYKSEKISVRLSILAKVNAQSRQTADFREGISSFLEKRKPNWVE